MTMTASQRQARFRLSRPTANGGEGEVRINTYISSAAGFALKRLAARYAVTQREMLERLIKREDEKVSKRLSSDQEFDAYFQCQEQPSK